MDMISNLRSAAATSGGTGTGASNGTAFLMDTTVPDSASSETVHFFNFLKVDFFTQMKWTHDFLNFILAKNGIGPSERDGSNNVFCYGQYYVNESTIFHKIWWNKIMVSDLNRLE